MPSLRLLANMNISPKTVEVLRAQGWDIVRVAQLLPKNATDQQILDLAREQGRTVVTQDLDFSALLALGGHDRPSLVTLRLAVADPETVSQRVKGTLGGLEQMLQKGCAVTIEDHTVRVRTLPIE